MLLLVLLLALGWGCAGLTTPASYDYFATPESRDPWSRKIHGWQLRERYAGGEDAQLAPASVAEPGSDPVAAPLADDLQAKFESFRAERRRAMARDIAAWIQAQARNHYVADGPIDHWATLADTLRRNGDDCDGLELLTYHLLRDLGFATDEVYRAIVYRRSDGQHHMVTLWFEDREDPWVIDPTGAMTSGMPRMSEVPGWAPLKVFSAEQDFSVERVASTR